MKTALSSICMAAAITFVPAAYAQGEIGPAPKAPVYAKPTPDQRAAGRNQRSVEGRESARSGTAGELGFLPKAETAKRHSKEDKANARAIRKADTVRANKAGELASPGEVGSLK